MEFLEKMKGSEKSPPRAKLFDIVWAWLGSFLGITTVAYINYRVLDGTDAVMIIGSFGASAVLIYGAIHSPLAQPRNFVGGHVVSALVGVTAYQACHEYIYLAAGIAVATAIAAMYITKTLHPPGGATALIAVIGSAKIHALGYIYVIMPVGVGAMIMLIIALLVNNVPRNRRYPVFWR